MYPPPLDYHCATYRMNTRFHARSVVEFFLHGREKIHLHPADFPDIFWCIEGVGKFIMNGKSYLLHPGHVWYYPPGSVHRISCNGNCFHYRGLAMDGPDAAVLFEGLNIKPGINYAGDCPEHLFAALALNIESFSPEVQLENISRAVQILTLAASGKSKQQKDLTGKAREIIDENFANPGLNVEKIAELLRVNRSVLSRTFSAEMKISPVEYLASRRMQEAMRLLRQSDLPINKIAEMCGYSSAGYFTKVVRKRTGNLPGKQRYS